MEKSIAPSAGKAQELRALWQGPAAAQRGEEVVSLFVRLSPERGWQEAVADDHALAWGRARSAPRRAGRGSRTGSENGTVKTAAGVRRVQGPQRRGHEAP